MRTRKLIFLYLAMFSSLLIAGNPVSVPLDHPVYAFLDRIETLGIIENIRDGVKPFDRERIGYLLIDISKNSEKLTGIDQQKLANYIADFRYEIDRSEKYKQIPEGKDWYSPLMNFEQIKADFYRIWQQNQPEEENHVILWEDSLNSFYFDFVKEFSYDYRSDKINRSNNAETYNFRGTINSNFGYYLQVSLMALNGNELYRNSDPILKNSWVNIGDTQTFFDRSGGDLAYRSPFLDFRFAIQPTTWGLGESGKLLLSDYVEQYTYLSLAKHWDWGSFVFMHGKLLSLASNDSVDNQALYGDKWLAVNRFEFSPISGMAVGLSGMIIYGNRSADWAYLFPINYFRAIEHNLRDRDNALLAIDLEANVMNGVKMYGTVLLDEFKSSELFTNWFGNKHGFQLGAHIADPFQLPNLTFRFEYIAIMPWVYTHRYNINRYINDGRSLGYWAGPNSQVLYFHLQKEWHHRFKTGFKYRQWKHGDNFENENIGGDILIGHDTLLGNQKEARQTRKFLEGILSTQNRIEFYTQYEIFNDLFLSFSVANEQTKQSANKLDLTEYHFGFKFDY